MKLFEFPAELAAVHALLDEAGGELDEAGILEKWFADIVNGEAVKLDGYVHLIRQLDMEAAAATEEAERWQMKAEARANAAKRLKARLKDYLTLTGRTKVETAAGRVISVQANGGKPPLTIAEGTDPNEVDEPYKKITVDFDTDFIRKSLEAGKPLEFAKLEPRGSHLRIR